MQQSRADQAHRSHRHRAAAEQHRLEDPSAEHPRRRPQSQASPRGRPWSVAARRESDPAWRPTRLRARPAPPAPNRSRPRAQVSAMAVVSCPASSKVITWSRVCRSVSSGTEASRSSTGLGRDSPAQRPRTRSSTTCSSSALSRAHSTGHRQPGAKQPAPARSHGEAEAREQIGQGTGDPRRRLAEVGAEQCRTGAVERQVRHRGNEVDLTAVGPPVGRPSRGRRRTAPGSPTICRGWKAGCRIRRCRRCVSPSLVSRPSPSRSRARTSPRPLPVRRAWVVSSSQTLLASSMSSTRSDPTAAGRSRRRWPPARRGSPSASGGKRASTRRSPRETAGPGW